MQPDILPNPAAGPLPPTLSSSWAHETLAFHQQLPGYKPTALRELSGAAATRLGLRAGGGGGTTGTGPRVFVKDESDRFGLPAFKVLGASWAVFRAACLAAGLDYRQAMAEGNGDENGFGVKGGSLRVAGAAARAAGVRLVACTEGNWGRAVAWTAGQLGVPAHIYVPAGVDEATRALIAAEGGGGTRVTVVQADYDAAVRRAEVDAAETGALLVMDTAWPGYRQDVPAWVVEGYATMLYETDRQLRQALLGHESTEAHGNKDEEPATGCTMAVASVGVGSFAQAVARHYRGQEAATGRPVKVVAVEPDTAACFRASMEAGRIVSVETGHTIMCGMNCGTVSTLAWDVLRNGVDKSVVVTDLESHQALQTLHDEGIMAGPCGAATLAAVRKLAADDRHALGKEDVVVLFSTEGARPYQTPSGPV